MPTTTVEPSSETQTGSEDSSSNVGGIVAGCVVGVVLCVIIVVLLILLLVWYQRRKKKNEGTQGTQLSSKYIATVVGDSVYLCTCIAHWLLYVYRVCRICNGVFQLDLQGLGLSDTKFHVMIYHESNNRKTDIITISTITTLQA